MLSISPCSLCPRLCGACRDKAPGLCGCGSTPRLARAALHFWEEPCLSGTRGSGAIFFSGCSLGCCFCQNASISAENFGQDISVERLSEIFLELQAQGAHNLNLVTATPWLPFVREALSLARPGLRIPVVYNCGGYELVEAVESLRGYVDIFLPDLKFFSPALSGRYAKAPDYFDVASKALAAMAKLAGPPAFDGDGLLQKGLVIRHLVLPGARRDSFELLRWMHDELPKGGFLLSLMSQYTPYRRDSAHPELNRRVTTLEYQSVVDRALELGLDNGYSQQRTSAEEEYTPAFDLEGVLPKNKISCRK